MKIAILGDISFNDIYNSLYQSGVRPFDKVGEFLQNNEYVVGNLESLCEGLGENLSKYTRVKTKQSTLNYLKHIGVNIVELAHNHAYDTLKEGFENTISFLDNNNIRHIGAATNIEDAQKPLIIEDNDSSICILNFVHKDTNPTIPNGAEVYVNIFDYQRVKKEIQEYKRKYDIIIVLLHWGGRTEGGSLPDFYQPSLAHQIIDDGADIVIGTHSHAIQPYEVYKDKYIFYGLGNFCFSRIGYKTPNKNAKMFWMCQSLIPIISIEHKQITTIEVYQTDINKDGSVVFGQCHKHRASKLFYFIFSNRKIWNIYWFYFRHIRPIIEFIITDTMTLRQKFKKIGHKLGLTKNI